MLIYPDTNGGYATGFDVAHSETIEAGDRQESPGGPQLTGIILFVSDTRYDPHVLIHGVIGPVWRGPTGEGELPIRPSWAERSAPEPEPRDMAACLHEFGR